MMNISMRDMDKAISINVYIYGIIYICMYVYSWVGVLANLFNED